MVSFAKKNLSLDLSQFGVDEDFKTDLAKSLKDAHDSLWRNDDIKSWMVYGPDYGDPAFLTSLAGFLGQHYGSSVDKDSLLPALSTNYTLRLLCTQFTTERSVAIVEEWTHQSSACILEDMGLPIYSVPLDQEGLDATVFESIAKNKCNHSYQPGKYAGIAYLMPALQDPTGITYSEKRCLKLLEIARRFNILIVCNDSLAPLLSPESDSELPKRMFTLDRKEDDEYRQGHVVSIGNFSSLLSATVDFGWMELPRALLTRLAKSNEWACGGSVAYYWQGIFKELLPNSAFGEVFNRMKRRWKEKLRSVHQQLITRLPKNCDCHLPLGGYFLWLDINGVDAQDLLENCMAQSQISFLPACQFSKTSSRRSSLRICVANLPESKLAIAVDQIIATSNLLTKKE